MCSPIGYMDNYEYMSKKSNYKKMSDLDRLTGATCKDTMMVACAETFLPPTPPISPPAPSLPPAPPHSPGKGGGSLKKYMPPAAPHTPSFPPAGPVAPGTKIACTDSLKTKKCQKKKYKGKCATSKVYEKCQLTCDMVCTTG